MDSILERTRRREFTPTGQISQPANFDFSHLRYRCAECGEGPASACTSCNKIKYCGRNCQKAAWKRVHKLVCGSADQLGYPTTEKLEGASFRQLTFALDEWSGCCMSVTIRISTIIRRPEGPLRGAASGDVARMARVVARLLDEEIEPGRECQLCNALQLAVSLTTCADLQGDAAIASTPLLSVTICTFLAMAPKFADCDFQGDTGLKSAIPINYVIGALTNQLSHGTVLSPSIRELLKLCIDASLVAIIDCSTLIRDFHAGRGTSEAFSNLETRCGVLYGKTLQEDSILGELRKLVRNLSFWVVAPTDASQAETVFLADIGLCEDRSHASQAAVVQEWMTNATNFSVNCGLDVSALKHAISICAFSDGIRVSWKDESC
jgi:hypothetical protein